MTVRTGKEEPRRFVFETLLELRSANQLIPLALNERLCNKMELKEMKDED